MGLCNYLNNTNKRSDTYKFLKEFRPAAAEAAHEFEIVNIANAHNDQGPYTPKQIAAFHNIEGNLDAQVMLSIGWPTPLTAFSTGGSPPYIPDKTTPTDTNEPYLTFLNYALAQDDLPQVISTSYGDDEQTVPESYAKRACAGYAQLGARGISIIFSSGDFGVGLPHKCFSNTNPNKREFLPTFPGSCPWVTTVGGTKGFSPEVAVYVKLPSLLDTVLTDASQDRDLRLVAASATISPRPAIRRASWTHMLPASMASSMGSTTRPEEDILMLQRKG